MSNEIEMEAEMYYRDPESGVELSRISFSTRKRQQKAENARCVDSSDGNIGQNNPNGGNLQKNEEKGV